MIHEFYLILGLFILFDVIFFLLIGWKNIKENDITGTIIGAILLSAISLFISFLISEFICWVDSNTTHYYKRYCNITSIKNNDEIKGHFSLGSGTIEQVEYYYYYYRSTEGYVRGKQRVDECFIVEDNTDIPHIEERYCHYESKSGLFKYVDDNSNCRYKIVVPKGTVISKFEIY